MGLAKTALAIGIAILFTVFVAYGVYVVYEPPKYSSEYSNCYKQFNCEDIVNDCYPEKNATEPFRIDDDCYQKARNSPEYLSCMKSFDECEEAFLKTTEKYRHARNSFFALILIGVSAIIGGIFLNRLEGIGAGFIGGGVLVILWSLPYTWRYWLELSKYMKLFVLGGVLVLLVYLGYRRIDRVVKKTRK